MARTLPIRLRTIAAAVVVIATGLIIWNAYQSIINTTDPTSQTLPIIAADKEPFRVLPEDPGGAEIPNQGSRLFNVLNSENADDLALNGIKIDPETETGTIESSENEGGFQLPEIPETRKESLYSDIGTLKQRQEIQEDPELTIMEDDSREELKEKLHEAIAQVEEAKEENVVEAPVEEVAPTEENNEITLTVPVPASKPSVPAKPTKAQAVVKKEDKPAEAPKKFSVDRLLSKESTQGGYYIQLASVQSEADARAAYGRIRDEFPKLVEGVSVVFPKADLGSRGTFYRIQIGPFSQAEADKRCADYRMKARGGTCLVVSR